MRVCQFLVLILIGVLSIGVRIRAQIRATRDIEELDQIGFITPDESLYTLNDYTKHPCNRLCVANEAPRTCKYQFKVELYETLSPAACRNCPTTESDCARANCILADGVRTPIIVVNRLLPGPTINLCLHDTVIVDVLNALNETTVIHWHGEHQRDSPYMDGVGLVTQAPIPPGRAYRYAFVVQRVGTLFWHSHINSQRAFGLVGRMIIRVPPNMNPHQALHDFDQFPVIISDWPYNLQLTVRNILINGKGRNRMGNTPQGLYEWFEVTRGKNYRFRMVSNTFSNCPLEVSVDGHDLLVISTDGNDIEPVRVGSVVLFPGERYDFVLAANQPNGNYWMRVRGRGVCAASTMFQGAIIHYQAAPRQVPNSALLYDYNINGTVLNGQDLHPGTRGNLAVSELNGLTNPNWRDSDQFRRMYIEFARGSNQFEINQIGYVAPAVVVLVEKDLIDDSHFCNREKLVADGVNCLVSRCQCTNVPTAGLGEFVEIIFFGSSTHPIHLHGYSFNVVGAGSLVGPATLQSVIDEDANGRLPRRNARSPLKDTIQMVRDGYIIVRFRADNPGYWLLHCHIETHSDNGMTAILKVGENYQMLSQPNNFKAWP